MEEPLIFNNAELLLIESALSIAKEESGYFIGPGQDLYDKVRSYLESKGYRFNEDGSYHRISAIDAINAKHDKQRQAIDEFWEMLGKKKS